MYREFVKKPLDTLLAFCGVLVLGLPMIVIATLIKLDSKGPALFKQERLGKNMKPFTVRTMSRCSSSSKLIHFNLG